MDEGAEEGINADTDGSSDTFNGNGGGIPVTGWEAERAICYGTGQYQRNAEEGNAGVFRQTLSPDPSSLPAYDVVIGSARLVGNLQSMIDDNPKPDPDATSKPAGMDKKEWQKIAEKKPRD